MANWCSNKVEFIGEQGRSEQLASLFQAMAKKEQKNRSGQLPECAEISDTNYFFHTVWDNGILTYDTKWSPNIGAIIMVAVRYGVGFIHRYSEPSNGIFGEAQFIKEVYTEIELDWDDIGRYEYDGESGMYRFENQNYECAEDVLQIMLDRKKAAARQKDLDPFHNDPSETL